MQNNILKINSPIAIVDSGTPSTTNLPKGSIALEKNVFGDLKIHGNIGGEVIEQDSITALANGSAPASFVSGRGLKVNAWEYYWKDVWEESEASAKSHVASAGVTAVIKEISDTGVDTSQWAIPTTTDELITKLKGMTINLSNKYNSASGYGSITYGIMNSNASTTTIVEGMRQATPANLHRSHIEGQYMTFPDLGYAIAMHVEGQDNNIIGYASLCHLEGNGTAVVYPTSAATASTFFSSGCATHAEGLGTTTYGTAAHAEGSDTAAFGYGSHAEGLGYFRDCVSDWKKYSNRSTANAVTIYKLWQDTVFGRKSTSDVYKWKFSAALGSASHVEGSGNITYPSSVTLGALDSGVVGAFVTGSQHAEGAGNAAYGPASHAEGIRTEATGTASHTSGIMTRATNQAEFACGQFNTSTTSDSTGTLFSVGCGTSDSNRFNAFEVRQNGLTYYLFNGSMRSVSNSYQSTYASYATKLQNSRTITVGQQSKKFDGTGDISFDIGEYNPWDQWTSVFFKDYIKSTFSGGSYVVLSYNPNIYTSDTAYFNGQTYTLSKCKFSSSSNIVVFDVSSKAINCSTAAEQSFMKAVTDVWYLPTGIQSYSKAFNPGSTNSNRFTVHCDIDMSSCVDCSYMFTYQQGMTAIDVSQWDVSKVRTFYHIFSTSSVPDPLDVSNWQTSSCTSMACMFMSMHATDLDLSNFDTSNVTDMKYMFYSAVSDSKYKKKTLYGLDNFDTRKVTNFSWMFNGVICSELDLSSWSLESATNVQSMFSANSSCCLTLGKEFFNAPNITSFDLSMFYLSSELKSSLINCFNRTSAGQSTLTLKLPTNTMSGVTALTTEEKAAITAKGYTLS